MPEPLDLRPAFPAVILAVTGLAVLLAQAFTPKGRRAPWLPLALLGLAAALGATIWIAASPVNGRGSVLGGTLAADGFALFFHVLILSIGILVVLLSPGYLRD